MIEHRGNECQTQGAAKARTQVRRMREHRVRYMRKHRARRRREHRVQRMRKLRNRNEADGDNGGLINHTVAAD